MDICITSFYRFTPLTDSAIQGLQSDMESFAARTGLRGLCLLGNEGVNLTVSGSEAAVSEFKNLLTSALGLPDLVFKDSRNSKHPFLVFKVKVKDEIVTLGRPDLAPAKPVNSHLSPSEWHAALQDPEVLVLDTRNDYEVDIGKFRNAIDFNTKEFREFPEAVKQAGIPKDKKVLMYCTGGIRCEKALMAMQEQGYSNVFQLEGGILNYLKEYPFQEFEGECFVFDYRVAVDQNLQPTQKYLLCPHCGQPANLPITCVQCSTEAVICKSCTSAGLTVCSKNCAHHLEIGSGPTKPHSQELIKRRAKASALPSKP